MRNYGRLILRQQMLLGLIRYCTIVKDSSDNYVYTLSGSEMSYEYSVVIEEYEKLFKLLEEEKQLLIKQGKNPVDYHPNPVYCVDATEDAVRYVAECEFKIKSLIKERFKV